MSRIVRPAGIVCLCVLAQCMAMCPSDYGLPGYGINLGEQRRCLSVVAAKMSSVPWNANWLGTANKICSNLFESGRLANLTTFPPLPQLFNNAWALSLNGSFVIVGGCALRSSRMKNAQIESDGFPLHTDNYGYSKCSPKIVRQFLQTLGSIHYHRGSNVSRYGLIGMGLRNSRDKLLLICAYYELGRAEAAPNYFACTNKSFPVDYVACEHPTLQQACIGVDKQGKECRCAPGRRGPFCAAYDVTREERYRRSFSAMVFRTPDCRGFCPEHALCTPKDPKSSSTTYYCQCHWAYNGENCENKWSQCHLSKFCIPHGWCKDTIFKLPSGRQYSHTCICDAGWTGADCMTDIDECLSNPCQNSGTCLDAVNTFACECQLGYTGLLCEKDLNECLNDPCVNGRCINEFGSFACDCYHGYTGKNCEIEINECDSNPCHYGTCHDLPNSYFCVCMDGFTGHHCETPINECVSNPCKNNGTCVKKARGFICQCPAHIKGRLCDGGTTMCSTNPCKAGGTCKPTKEGFECRCRIGRTGETCEKDINECLQRPCKNNGQCVDGDGMYTCRCMDGFVGVSCEIGRCSNF